MNKKLKRFSVSALAIILLGSYSYNLIKGEKSAKKIVTNHRNDITHQENIVAHRGFSGLYQDNSMEGVKEALNSDCVDMIEIDVRMTNDRKLVLHHDPFIILEDLIIGLDDLILTNLDQELVVHNFPLYNIEELLYDDTLFLFKRFITKNENGSNLVKLEDLVNWYNFSKPLIIDVKTSGHNLDLIKELDRILNPYKDKIFIQSDCYDFLVWMKKLYPDYKYLYIIKNKDSIKKPDIGFWGYTIKYSLLDDIEINSNKMYLVYTFNTNKKYFNLLNNKNYQSNMYIITDNPDYICALGNDKKLRK